MTYASVYDCENKYDVYLNGKLQSDVISADDTLGEIWLFEHDSQGQRVPWYNEQTSFKGWAAIECRGEVRVEVRVIEEQTTAPAIPRTMREIVYQYFGQQCP